MRFAALCSLFSVLDHPAVLRVRALSRHFRRRATQSALQLTTATVLALSHARYLGDKEDIKQKPMSTSMLHFKGQA